MFVLQSRLSRRNIHRDELRQKMSSPTQQSLAKLTRLVRYLKSERQWAQVCKYGKRVEELTVFTDSDWAGCNETRKSSSAGVVMLGGHTLKGVQTKAEGHCKEQRRGRAVCGSIRSVRIRRDCVVAEKPRVREETSAGH